MGLMYRSELPGPEILRPRAPFATRRPPGYVPYVVDNLWEWARPDKFPSRRHSVFASPVHEYALKSGPHGGTVYRVELLGTSTIAQARLPDSRDHPECRSLLKLLRQHLRQEWFDASLDDKWHAGGIFVPCLTKQEVEEVVESSWSTDARADLRRAIRYWTDVRLIQPEEPWPFPSGEVFFVADKWQLVDL